MKELLRDKYFDMSMSDVFQKKLPVIVWQNVDDVIFKCNIYLKSFKKDIGEFEFYVSEKDVELFRKITIGKRVISLYVPASSISFNVFIDQYIDDTKFKTSIPENYQFFNRRENERVQPTETTYVTFEYQKQTFKKYLFDISVGGLSLVIPKADRFNLEKGAMITNFVIHLENKKIKVHVECVNSFSVDRYKVDSLPYGGQKIAFKFIKIQTQDKIFINEYVEKNFHQSLPFLRTK